MHAVVKWIPMLEMPLGKVIAVVKFVAMIIAIISVAVAWPGRVVWMTGSMAPFVAPRDRH